MEIEDVSLQSIIRDIKKNLKISRRRYAFFLLLVMCSYGYVVGPILYREDNRGAVPSHVAVDHAKTEAFESLSGRRGFAAGIRPYHGGWCVVVNAVANDGRRVETPVFVEQNGRAWRTDPIAAKKYDGGADGRYMSPGWTAGCTVKS